MVIGTRLPFNLRPTTRECVHLVRRGNVTKMAVIYTIRPDIPENPMMHAQWTALYFTEPELLPIEVLHCGNRDFGLFCSCDLTELYGAAEPL